MFKNITFVSVKKQTIKYWSYLTLVIVVLSISSCVEDETCGENTVTGVLMTVQNSGNDNETDTDELDQTKVSDWKICAVGDTLPLYSKSTDYQYGLPLDLEDTTVSFVFYIKDDSSTYLTDTVQFDYRQTDMKLVSVACGFAPEFLITGGSHGSSVLDSVVVEQPVVSTDLTLNNVAFYY